MHTLVCSEPLKDSVPCMYQMVLYRTGFVLSKLSVVCTLGMYCLKNVLCVACSPEE
jgi:hypothetical protein